MLGTIGHRPHRPHLQRLRGGGLRCCPRGRAVSWPSGAVYVVPRRRPPDVAVTITLTEDAVSCLMTMAYVSESQPLRALKRTAMPGWSLWGEVALTQLHSRIDI